MIAIRDWFPPPRPRVQFDPVDGKRLEKVAAYFDRDGNGKLSNEEMNNASSTLKMIGEMFGNKEIANMGKGIEALKVAIENGNKNVDKDGDGQLEIRAPYVWDPRLDSTAVENPTVKAGGDASATAVEGKPMDADLIIKPLPPFPNPRKSELSQVIENVDPQKYQLTMEDLDGPAKTNFKDVKKELARAVLGLLDRDDNGVMSTKELKSGADILNRLAKLMGNDMLTNLGNMFTRLYEEVSAGNRAVDADGDGGIRYRDDLHILQDQVATGDMVAKPAIWRPYPYNEFDAIANRNDPNLVQVADMNNDFVIYPPIAIGLRVAEPVAAAPAQDVNV